MAANDHGVKCWEAAWAKRKNASSAWALIYSTLLTPRFDKTWAPGPRHGIVARAMGEDSYVLHDL